MENQMKNQLEFLTKNIADLMTLREKVSSLCQNLPQVSSDSKSPKITFNAGDNPMESGLIIDLLKKMKWEIGDVRVYFDQLASLEASSSTIKSLLESHRKMLTELESFVCSIEQLLQTPRQNETQNFVPIETVVDIDLDSSKSQASTSSSASASSSTSSSVSTSSASQLSSSSSSSSSVVHFQQASNQQSSSSSEYEPIDSRPNSPLFSDNYLSSDSDKSFTQEEDDVPRSLALDLSSVHMPINLPSTSTYRPQVNRVNRTRNLTHLCLPLLSSKTATVMLLSSSTAILFILLSL